MEEKDITEKNINCAFKVHNILGFGFLEKVYENALVIELAKESLKVKQQEPVKVYYRGEVVGEYCVDLLVENRIVVELKSVRTLIKEHEVQLVNYLNAAEIDFGLLINFGTSVQVKRKFRKYVVK